MCRIMWHFCVRVSPAKLDAGVRALDHRVWLRHIFIFCVIFSYFIRQQTLVLCRRQRQAEACSSLASLFSCLSLFLLLLFFNFPSFFFFFFWTFFISRHKPFFFVKHIEICCVAHIEIFCSCSFRFHFPSFRPSPLVEIPLTPFLSLLPFFVSCPLFSSLRFLLLVLRLPFYRRTMS